MKLSHFRQCEMDRLRIGLTPSARALHGSKLLSFRDFNGVPGWWGLYVDLGFCRTTM